MTNCVGGVGETQHQVTGVGALITGGYRRQEGGDGV